MSKGKITWPILCHWFPSRLIEKVTNLWSSDVFTGSGERSVAWNGIDFTFFYWSTFKISAPEWSKQWKQTKQTNSEQNYNKNNGNGRCSYCSEVLLFIFNTCPPLGKLLYKRSVQINTSSVKELAILEITSYSKISKS